MEQRPLMRECNICKEVKPIENFKRRGKGYRYVCKLCHNIQTKKWRIENKERFAHLVKQWKENNRERWRLNKRRQESKRRETVIGKLHNSIHNGVYAQLKKGKKGRGVFLLLGYSPEELKKHLEHQFENGMSWENYGKWHLDHIIPVAAFNIKSSGDLDFKRCWELKNLRPLWAIDNMKKQARLDKPFQPSLCISV